MRHFDIRVELPNGHFHDRAVNAPTAIEARGKFECMSGYRYFDWRGLVAFVDGAKPAEEAPRKLRYFT